VIRGFDASSVQGHIPFADAAKTSLAFGIFKCWTGNDGPDPNFEANVLGAETAGLVAFAYCFAFPLPEKAGHPGRDPKEQAKLFFDHAWKVCPGRPIFVDFEWPEPKDWAKWGCTAESISEWMRECCEELTRLCGGIAPIIYTYPDWWTHVSFADVSWAAEYSLWIASYVTTTWPTERDEPFMVHPWTDWLFWQWDGNGGQRLPNGVDADFVVFNGDADALRALVRA
jgi:GH25 family lysozyme M1 (1,4-beta-N-acetylmuramidase)